MTHIGPRPTIASFTMGAAHPFRVRTIKDSNIIGPETTYSISLPHNSLLIMFPPSQERYRHEIPLQKSKRIPPHPISGTKRINLTFRMYRPEYGPDFTPVCHCGNRVDMKPVFKFTQNHGRYFYFCSSFGNPLKNIPPGTSCNFFEWVNTER